jgi:hypothetical protein
MLEKIERLGSKIREAKAFPKHFFSIIFPQIPPSFVVGIPALLNISTKNS